MKAIILAAGKGRRLKKKFNKPKSLITLKNSETILGRICRILSESNINEIIIVTGYKSELIKKLKIKNSKIKYFSKYSKSNNLQTLLSVKEMIKGELLCLFADIIFDKKIITKLILNKKKDILLAIKRKKILKDTMRVRIKNKNIYEIGSHVTVDQADGNFIGIAKFSSQGSKILKKYLIKNKNNLSDYYTKVLNFITKETPIKINYVDIKNSFWKEVDTEKDFNIVKNLQINN